MAATTDSTSRPEITVEVSVKRRVAVTHLHVDARVRYWEYASVSGQEDTDGTLIPLRAGDCWRPTIDLETGRVADWPPGTSADIHYKICDEGRYWLTGPGGVRLDWRGDYVPDDLRAVGSRNFGDYIILKIDGRGQIEGWNVPALEADEWAPSSAWSSAPP